MKLAISGKGGVGKSTIAAALALLLAEKQHKVLAVDADPDANLGAALGLSAAQQAAIVPISQQTALIEQRTGAKVDQYGQVFKLNPAVADLAETYAVTHAGVALLVLGAVVRGGGGCACPESVLLRALVSDVVLFKDEALIMDMEAGVEHLGRATARGVDAFLVVVEPGQRSLDCAQRIVSMAAQIGITNISFVANKVASVADEAFLRANLPAESLLACIPYSEQIRQADRDGCSVLDQLDPGLRAKLESILDKLQTKVRELQ